MFRKGWQELKRGRPGRRFQDRYARRRESARGVAGKCAFVCAGALLLAGGIVLLPLPGPGMLIIAFGAFVIAEGSRTAARALDALELRVRGIYSRWRSSPRKQPRQRSGSHSDSWSAPRR